MAPEDQAAQSAKGVPSMRFRSQRRRVLPVSTATVLLAGSLLAGAPPSASAQSIWEHVGSIQVGGRIDIQGEYLGTGQGSAFEQRQYTFDVLSSKGRLRVSLDLSNRDDCVQARLLDPRGNVVGSNTDYGFVCPFATPATGQVFNIEQSKVAAKAGRWTLDVRASDVQDLSFRARIVLEPPRALVRNSQLRPDLVPWLPWEFGFVAPGSSNPGTANDRDNTPGAETVSCHPTEETSDTKCLRFSAGVYNVGDGPMYVDFRNETAYQHVYLADQTPYNYADNEARGRFLETEAGTGEWHPYHEHRHISDFVLYELYSVQGQQLTKVGDGAKHGYCTFSQQIFDWGSTAQDPQYASYPSGEFCNDAMTLERGWGDIYRWQRPGQYVSYDSVAEQDGSMQAGKYLLRFTVDPDDHVVETNETNNMGYALIEVIDGGGPGEDNVVICEQGMGPDPWATDSQPRSDRFAWAKLLKDPNYTPATCS